jgi:hypothetical protein
MRPYTPLELAGRNIYVREGCYNCHSQMIRPLRDEVERYGHYSLAAESMYDHPFQWGSKRTGPTSRASAASIPTSGTRSSQRSALGGAGLDHAGLSVARDRARLRAHRRRPEGAGACSACPTREMIENAKADCGRRRTRRSRTPTRFAKRYPEGAGARLRRQSAPHHRGRRADRLPADARHAGRLQALRQQGQHPLSRARRSSTKRRACRCGRTEHGRRQPESTPSPARDDRPRVGRHPRTQHAAAALVAVDLLRHHRLVGRLLDRLSGVAADHELHAGTSRLAFARGGGRGSRALRHSAAR